MKRFLQDISRATALLALPALLLVAGCDSDDPIEPDPPELEPGTAVNYDTLDAVGADGNTIISITESDNEEGIAPVDMDGNVIGVDDGDNVTWSNDYTYVLNGRVFVNDGQTLTIEEGTIVRGDVDFSDPSDASALIVAQGGMIDAVGTPDDPIVFTAEGVSIEEFPFGTNELWGGIIMLGTAPNNVAASGTGSDLINVEGIPENVTRGRYGCDGNAVPCEDDDDSGTFQYVSIRHGGTSIGAQNEIQGLTLGSVGNGTTIDHVEVMSNLDDGFEWFGGTVDMSHLVVAFVGDDAFDIDQGYTGKLQHLLAVQGFNTGGNGGEHDGAVGDLGGEGSTPLTDPQICNATYLGASAGDLALLLRDNFTGDYYNSIFTAFPDGALEVEDLADTDVDSRGRFEEGELNLEGNFFTGYDSDDWADVIQLTTDDDNNVIDESFRSELAEYLGENNTLNADIGVSAYDGNIISVIPSGAAANVSSNSECLEDADYAGAFDPNGDNWAEGWTTLSQAGILGN